MTRIQIKESDYAFVEKPMSWDYSIMLKTGPYTGIVYKYGKVSISEKPETMEAVLNFQYAVIECVAPYSIEELQKSNEFRNHLGDILTNILETTFASGNYKIGNGNKPTVNNSPKTHQR